MIVPPFGVSFAHSFSLISEELGVQGTDAKLSVTVDSTQWVGAVSAHPRLQTG